MKNELIEPAKKLLETFGQFFLKDFAVELNRLSILQSTHQLSDEEFLNSNSFM
jgi:hypothetical protein